MGGTRVSLVDRCRIHSSSKLIGVRSFFSLYVLWEIDARVWQFLWISWWFRVLISELGPAVFSRLCSCKLCAVLGSFMYLKIIGKLYSNIRRQHLSFGINISLESLMGLEIWLLFVDALALSEIWTQLNTCSFMLSYLHNLKEWSK